MLSFFHLLSRRTTERNVKLKYRAAHKAGFLIGIDTQSAEDFLVRVASIAPWSTIK